MKKTLTALLTAAALAVSAFTAKAQTAGVYFFAGFSGGTNTVLAQSTNLYKASYVWTQYDLGNHESGFGTSPGSPFIRVDEYTNVEITIAASATANFTGTVPFRFAKSFDGGNWYEANPSVICTLTFNNTNSAETSISVEMIGADVLALVDAWNTNAVTITNLYGVVTYKVGKVSTRQAVQ